MEGVWKRCMRRFVWFGGQSEVKASRVSVTRYDPRRTSGNGDGFQSSGSVTRRTGPDRSLAEVLR